MTSETMWSAQARQNQVSVEIIVQGISDWHELFSMRAVLEKEYGELKAGQEISFLDLLTEEARLNNVSVERTVLSQLVERGYKLEELEVEFDGNPEQEKWGRCIWYKEHKSYSSPSRRRKRSMPDASPESLSLACSMFKTEHCGDQEFTLMSMQMVGAFLVRLRDPEDKFPVPFLFHKTLVFRRAVLSAPKSLAQAA